MAPRILRGALLILAVLASPALLASPLLVVSAPANTLLSTSLPGTDGKVHRVDDWKGAVRIVNFWATWCAPCRSELPLLSATRQQWQDKGVEVIAIAVDADDEVRSFLSQAQLDFPVLVAEKQGQSLMRANGNTHASLPYTLLLDGQGNVLQHHAGVLDARLLRDWLAQAAPH